MKKIGIAGALLLLTLYGAQAQSSTNSSTNSRQTNPVTDGTTRNSGSGNASNGLTSTTAVSNSKDVVGADNGTSYGMQPSVTNSTSRSDSTRRKDRKDKRNKNN